MKLSGQEIKDLLEYSYGIWFDQMSDEHSHLILFKRNEMVSWNGRSVQKLMKLLPVITMTIQQPAWGIQWMCHNRSANELYSLTKDDVLLYERKGPEGEDGPKLTQ